MEHARLVAQHLNTEHHEISFTPEEGFQAIRDVIYTLESYDITTIRASVGMYLVAKHVKENTDTAIIFSGLQVPHYSLYTATYTDDTPENNDTSLFSNKFLHTIMDTSKGIRSTVLVSNGTIRQPNCYVQQVACSFKNRGMNDNTTFFTE